MKRVYNEVNYCIYIKKNDGFYKFAKESIINNDRTFVPMHEPITSKFVYNTFFMLFPILKEIPREKIMIQKAWESYHPLNDDMEMPKNEYNKQIDEFLTTCYKHEFFI